MFKSKKEFVAYVTHKSNVDLLIKCENEKEVKVVFVILELLGVKPQPAGHLEYLPNTIGVAVSTVNSGNYWVTQHNEHSVTWEKVITYQEMLDILQDKPVKNDNKLKFNDGDIKYKHYRNWNCRSFIFKDGYSNLGGYTMAYVIQGDKAYVGFSKCNPKENFNKKEGREYAKKRLLSSPLEISIDELNHFLHVYEEAYDVEDEDIVIKSIYSK